MFHEDKKKLLQLAQFKINSTLVNRDVKVIRKNKKKRRKY